MSSYLRNLKVSAHQSYITFKPCIFRAQSYPTIGFYSCAEQLVSSNQTALGLKFSALPIGSSSEKLSTRNSEVVDEIFTRKLKASTYGHTRGLVKAKSSLTIYRFPPDSLFQPNSIARAEKVSDFRWRSPRFLSDISDLPLCVQLQKTNVAIVSGYSEVSPHLFFCIGSENGIPPKTAATPASELRFAATGKRPPDQQSGKPSEEQLHRIHSALAENLPTFFTKTHNYGIYNKEVIFENNIRGITTRGLTPYMQQLTLIRVLGHLKYAHVKMEILKMTQHPEDGTVRVRWRVAGMPGLRVLLMIFRFWEYKKYLSKESEWIDGFSIFHVGADGLIYKHICDKMMPDENRETNVRGGNMAMKLALMVGLAPKFTGGLLGGLDSAIMTLGRVS